MEVIKCRNDKLFWFIIIIISLIVKLGIMLDFLFYPHSSPSHAVVFLYLRENGYLEKANDLSWAHGKCVDLGCKCLCF